MLIKEIINDRSISWNSQQKSFANLRKLAKTQANLHRNGNKCYFLHLVFYLNHLCKFSIDIQLLIYIHIN